MRSGLPGSFVEPWDDWLQNVLSAARAALVDEWEAIWLEAPVWRFLLPPGQCGPACVLGLWMPSIDAAGRHFPLTIAAIPENDATVSAETGGDWLDRVEEVGREAIAYDLSPDDLASRLHVGDCFPSVSARSPCRLAQWWTDGGPYVPPAAIDLPVLPDAARFAVMLKAGMRSDGPAPLHR